LFFHIVLRALVGPWLSRTSLASIREEGDGGCPADARRRRRRHRGVAAEGEEEDATLNLLLRHSDTTLATYV
jgi:hypothetical protein